MTPMRLQDKINIEQNGPVIKLSNNENRRSAILDIDCMSVYLFRGNRRIIATEHMNNKAVNEALNLCGAWVVYGEYKKSDFAA